MSDRIKVLIVDDIPETRDHLSKLLGFESDVEVVGAAAGGPEAIVMATGVRARRRPDGHQHAGHGRHHGDREARRRCADRRRDHDVRPGRGGLPPPLDARRRARVPGQAVQLGRADGVDPAGLGAREGQAEPATRRSPPPPRRSRNGSGEPASVVAVFSPKGGVGRTTIAVNLAVAAAQTGKRVALVDASFQFGDVGVLLNLNPRNKSIADLAGELQARRGRVARHVHDHPLLRRQGPPGPAVARAGRAHRPGRGQEGARTRCAASYDLIVVDCPSSFNEPTLAVLDEADLILTLLTLEITSVKNMRLFLEVCEQLGYGPEKIRLVLQPRGLDARHPGRGRRALDRAQGGPHDRQRRPQRGLRA